MKKLFLSAIVSMVILSCTNGVKTEEDASKKNVEIKATYEKNLATLKAGIAAFEKEDIEGWAAGIADSAEWTSPAYGDTLHTKAHWKESIKYYVDNWDNLKLNNAQFLAGVDAATGELDGSVRYYGQWVGVHTSGKATSINFYGTYNFNNDNKMIFGADYFDLGGLMNAVASPAK